MTNETIVIIGAGVLGLSTALHLQETLLPIPNVLIVARDIPGDESIDYATPWSGAHYRPIPDSSPQGLAEAALVEKTYDHFKKYAATYPEAGIQFMKGVELLETPTPAYLNVEGRYGEIDGFRVLSEGELPGGVKWGVEYKTYCVNTPVYLSHLMRRFVLGGGKVVRKQLSKIDDAFTVTQNVRTVINCSGVGFGDPKCFITRGQTCLVSNPSLTTTTRQNANGTWTFAIPRPLHGGTIIGGTKEEHDTEPSPRPETRKRLLEAAAKAFPELLDKEGKFRVIRDIVGRRPSRVGGMRLEVERVGAGRRVVHAYGAGGRGVELSRGVAEMVGDLMRVRDGQSTGRMKSKL